MEMGGGRKSRQVRSAGEKWEESDYTHRRIRTGKTVRGRKEDQLEKACAQSRNLKKGWGMNVNDQQV